MPYDPNRHHRQSIRVRGYDYTQPGAYFVTICTHERQLLFDTPALRRIAEQQWRRIANERVTLDTWVVMPNHVHGIIVITLANVAAINDVVAKGYEGVVFASGQRSSEKPAVQARRMG